MDKIVALVPARGGSLRVQNKNLLKFETIHLLTEKFANYYPMVLTLYMSVRTVQKF